jgi:hypothetical protein
MGARVPRARHGGGMDGRARARAAPLGHAGHRGGGAARGGGNGEGATSLVGGRGKRGGGTAQTGIRETRKPYVQQCWRAQWRRRPRRRRGQNHRLTTNRR